MIARFFVVLLAGFASALILALWRARRAQEAEISRLRAEVAGLRQRLAESERAAAGAETALLLHERMGEEELVQAGERGPAETPAPRGRTLH